MKFDRMVCEYEPNTLKALKEGASNVITLLKKRRNWTDPSFLNDKLRIFQKIINARDVCLCKSIEYQPTFICKHCFHEKLEASTMCMKTYGRPHPQPNQHHCSSCLELYSFIDDWVGSYSSQMCALDHILELCFNHRLEIVEDCKHLLTL